METLQYVMTALIWAGVASAEADLQSHMHHNANFVYSNDLIHYLIKKSCGLTCNNMLAHCPSVSVMRTCAFPCSPLINHFVNIVTGFGFYKIYPSTK